jgi:hypothetical protein|tara:strand:+ start:354 stop:566 length:213 start_codon:yes stop_codon:yes gene_type:complete
MKIIYNNSEGNVVVLWKVKENPRTTEEVAQRHVPTGVRYKIVEDSVIPTDQTFRDAWQVDEAELTDGVGT